MADEIAQLKQLQAGMNAAFDSLFQTAETDPKNVGAIAAAKDQIGKLSQIIFGTTLGPIFTVFGLSSQLQAYAAVRIGIDLNVFKLINKPSTLAELAEKTDANPVILQRILRALSTFGYLSQTGPTEWSPTPLTQILTISSVRDWMIAHFDERVAVTGRFPAWLKKRGYKTTGSVTDNVFTEVTGVDCWEYYEKHPEESKIFDSAMSIQESFPKETRPRYPFGDLDQSQLGEQEITLVDVGGGFGQAIKSIRAENPNLKGRFILQDLPKTISQIDGSKTKDDGFEAMAHDFFTPQPIKGAKFYHFRRVFHDWNDGPNTKILEATRDAMKETPNHSRLLIHESVLDDSEPSFPEAMVDLIMMQILDGMERTESQWRELLKKTGFEIVKIWRAEVGNIAIIEAALA